MKKIFLFLSIYLGFSNFSYSQTDFLKNLDNNINYAILLGVKVVKHGNTCNIPAFELKSFEDYWVNYIYITNKTYAKHTIEERFKNFSIQDKNTIDKNLDCNNFRNEFVKIQKIMKK